MPPLRRLHIGVLLLIAMVGVLLIAIPLLSRGDAEAHSGHTQKKLFGGRWFDPAMNLRTSNLNHPEVLVCDSNHASCSAKWIGPIQGAVNDWNAQPDTADFLVQGDFNLFYEINIVALDEIIQPGVLGLALFYNFSGDGCDPNACTYRYGEAYVADDSHVGVYGTHQSKQATVAHELGHLLNLRHESVNAGETVLYPCGQDNTGAIPVSVMSYDCVDPPAVGGSGIFTAQPFDTCGVNHAYPDAAFGNAGCVCFAPPTGPVPPPGNPAFFHPVTPARILDTRTGPGPLGKVGENCVISVQVAGVGGVPASGVSAVVVNATVTEPTSLSYLTLYPSGSSLPLASNLNFSGGQTIPNLVTVKVGADGKVNVYNNKGQTHVILDVAGWYDTTPGSSLREVSDPLDGSSRTNAGATAMAIDMNTAGNANATVGAIEQCARINENDMIDANEATNVDLNGDTIPDPDTLLIDLTVQGIEPYSNSGTPADPSDDTGGIIGYQLNLQYPVNSLTVMGQSLSGSAFAPVSSLISVNASSSIFDLSDPVPDNNLDSSWFGSALDTGSGVPEQGDGVLQRVAISTDIGVAGDQVLLTLADNAHLDAVGAAFAPTTTLSANIAINQACGPLITPTPSPTPSPSPSPSPTPTATPAGFGYYHPVPPARILDTRTGPQGVPPGNVGPSQTITVDVTGVGGVPATGVSAVVLNATVTGPTQHSYLTIFPSLAPMPLASNLNFGPGETIPNLVIVKVGSNGNINVFNKNGATAVILDVAGWFGGAGTDGKLFRSLTPTRILDTRTGPQGAPPGRVDHQETISVDVTVGAVPSNATAVILNVTVTQPTNGSFLTVFPSNLPAVPLVSNLNFDPNETVPNLVIVKVGANGNVNVYNAVGSVHVIFDVAGWYSDP